MNRHDPELTIRAVITGVVLGLLLTPCNIYTGLKIGWSFNMSITAALLSFGFWKLMNELSMARPWGLLESNINQTTASSAASIISGGLVAPIPAMTLVSGIQLPWFQLIAWVFSVSFLGIWLAYLLLNPFLVRASLPLPAGVATAHVLKDIFAKGREAMLRVYALGASAVVAAGVKLVDAYWLRVPRLSLPISVPAHGAAAGKISAIGLKNLTFFLDPSPLLLGFGVIIGIRIGLSLLLGALLAWGILAPWILANGWASVGNPAPDASWFAELVEWLLWPGVALMVCASVTSFGLLFVGRNPLDKRGPQGLPEDRPNDPDHESGLPEYRGNRLTFAGLIIASVLVVTMQVVLFGTSWWVAVIAVPMALVLAVVAGRVVGETGIPPIGAIGQVSQLSMGMIASGNPVANLSTANVAGGTAGQCADLLNDFKVGRLIGASPIRQVIAQCFGVLTGSVVGSLVYLALIPDPASMLITPEWPAPAVVTWKAVAETMQHGLSAIPGHARIAILVGGVVGVALATADRLAPQRVRILLPSAPALGLAFVIPASISIAMFLGAFIAVLLERFALSWSQRFLIAIASGFVAGESIAGVGTAILQVWF